MQEGDEETYVVLEEDLQEGEIVYKV